MTPSQSFLKFLASKQIVLNLLTFWNGLLFFGKALLQYTVDACGTIARTYYFYFLPCVVVVVVVFCVALWFDGSNWTKNVWRWW